MASFRRVLGKRIFNAFITIIMIMILNFALFRIMPGDPAQLRQRLKLRRSKPLSFLS